MRGNQARVKNADVRHPSSTVVMHRRKSASPVHNVLSDYVSQAMACQTCSGPGSEDKRKKAFATLQILKRLYVETRPL